MPSYSHPRPKRSAAPSLIEAAMSGGNEPLAADMMRMAVVAGIGEATWFTAKKEAGIGSRLDGMPGQSGQHWSGPALPVMDTANLKWPGPAPGAGAGGRGEGWGRQAIGHPIGIWAVDGD